MNKEVESYLGIDFSMTSTGIVIIDKEGTVVEFYTIKTTPSQFNTIYERATFIMSKLSQIFLTYPRIQCLLEAPALGAKGSRVYQLFGMHYMVSTLIYRYKGVVHQIPPTKLKKSVTGKGNSKKEEMLEQVPKDIQEDFTNANYRKTTGIYDLADAYHLANYIRKEDNGITTI